MKKLLLVILPVVGISLVSGCSMFRASVNDSDPEKAKKLTANYDQQDLLKLSQEMSDKLLADFPAPGEKPVVVEMGIDNATKSHIDTKTMTDTIVTKLMDSKKMDFVDSSRRDTLLREQGYQLANCTPETRAKIGKQLGARFMLTGRLSEIETEQGREVRVSKQRDVYYQLTVEMTDTETGVMKVRKQIQRMRTATKPIIGW
ncbi:MAG: hypothetical protein C0404_05490 [Verrucomicrobia bacterium]|nr:hypothetical protein [Verrucomicrobiota bacterium]